MTHLSLALHLEPIDFDKLTFPPLVVGEYTEGPRSYPAVVPAWRDPELHGTGEGFDLRALVVNYLWRGTEAPSDDVLAEVEAFNADPRRGWALLIRAAAAPEVDYWNGEVKRAKEYAKAAMLAVEAAEDLLADDEGDDVHP